MDKKTKPGEGSPILNEEVTPENPLKEIFVDYVGNKKQPEDDTVTVEMIIETLAEEFPEFLMVVAEENWIRGYHQALSDVEEGEKLYEEVHNSDDIDEDEEEQSGEISHEDLDEETISD